MKYIKAIDVLPKEILEMIQEYIDVEMRCYYDCFYKKATI